MTLRFVIAFSFVSLSCGGKAQDFGSGKQATWAKLSAQSSRVSSGVIYYVSPNGNDLNKGNSSSCPWKTIRKVNAVKLKPGDQVLFQGGHRFVGNIIVSSSGAKGQCIRYSSYGKGKAVIDAGSGTGINARNKSDVWIDSLVIKGAFDEKTQEGNDGYGIEYLNDLPGGITLGICFVSNCDISGFMRAGIQFMAKPKDHSSSGFSNLVVYANTVHDNSVAGISSLVDYPAAPGSPDYAFRNVYIGFNRVYHNLGYTPGTGGHTGDGIVIGSAGGGVIEHNVAWDNGWKNVNIKGGPAAIWCWDSTRILFQFNEAYGNGSASKVDGDGFDLDGGTTYCIMQYNYSHDNEGAGFLLWEYGNPRGAASHNILRYNISKFDGNPNGYSSIFIGANAGICSDNDFYNNTCFNIGSCVHVVDGNVRNRFFNNIFYSTDRDSSIVIVKEGGWFLNNDYYNSGGGFKAAFGDRIFESLSALRSSGIGESYKGLDYGYNVDPLLNNPANAGAVGTFFPNTLKCYGLNAGSPMKNAGIDLRPFEIEIGNNDFNGSKIPEGKFYDIGACQSINEE